MSVEFMIEDVKPGRVCQGKSRHGDAPDVVHLKMSGRRIYQLQQFIEDAVPKGGEFSQVKGLCFLYQELEASLGHGGSKSVVLKLSGRMLFEFQRYLEEQIRKGGDFFRSRWMVVLYEEIRLAYAGGDVAADTGT